MKSEIPTYMNYWGKADRETNSWHPLVCHMLDVAAVARQTTISNELFAQNWSNRLDLDQAVLLDIISFFSAIHDLGKFATDFQCKIPKLSERLIGIKQTNRIGEAHPSSAWLLWNQIIKKTLSKKYQIKSNLDSFQLSDYYSSLTPLLTASFGHHGAPSKKPPDCSPLTFNELYPESTHKAVMELVYLFIKIFPGIKNIFKKPARICEKKDQLRAFSFSLSGLIILADWTASDPTNFQYEYDMSESPDEKLSNPDKVFGYYKSSLEQAEQVIENQGIKSVKPATVNNPWSELFPNLQKYKPSPLQQTVLDYNISKEPSLYIIEDIAGAGKTEAALILICRLMQAGVADGFYFGLPTMATSNGMYPRIAELYQKLYTKGETPSLILAHGASALHEEYQKSILPGFQASENINLEHNGKKQSETQLTSSAACRQWLTDRSKKVFLAQVGVGSIDQAMLAVIYSRHFSLRMYGLGGRILVIDEVHAYDEYMQKIIQNLLQFQASQGKSVILLSATLPAYLKQNLADSFLSGLQNKSVNDSSTRKKTDSDFQNNSIISYPLMTVIQKEKIDPVPVHARLDNCRTIFVNFENSEGAIYSFIEKTSHSGDCIVWIRNTVKEVQLAYEYLAKKIPSDKLMMFHSRFAMQHRQDIENKVLKIFGSESNESERKGQVLIASQVVEQSLDLDFDEMISDLCPIDLLIQRAGRLRRHNRNTGGNRVLTADQRGQPTLNIYGPDPGQVSSPDWYKDYFKGAAYVYNNPGQLWRTARVLKDSGEMQIPEKSRFLVEKVYGSEAPEIPDFLIEQSNQSTSKDSHDRSTARLNQINLEEGYIRNEDIKPWPDHSAPTRLSEDTEVYRLCTVEGDSLQPLIKSKKQAWAMSEVKFRPLEFEYNQQDRALIKKCNVDLYDQGRGGKLMILKTFSEENDKSELYHCSGVLASGKTLLYDKWSGLRYE